MGLPKPHAPVSPPESSQSLSPRLAQPPSNAAAFKAPAESDAQKGRQGLLAAAGAALAGLGELYPDKILLVDDNHINLKILSAHMGKLGCMYESVVNGKQAVDAYARNPTEWAGILMDISMPVMDGLEATRRIRALEHRNQLRAVPILALTGLASDSAHREALESGVDVFLTKPVRLKMLSENMEKMRLLPRAPACGRRHSTKS